MFFFRLSRREKTVRCFSLKALAILANHRGCHLELSPRLRIPYSKVLSPEGVGLALLWAANGTTEICNMAFYRHRRTGTSSSCLSSSARICRFCPRLRMLGCPNSALKSHAICKASRDRILMMRSPLGLVIRQVTEKRSTFESRPHVESFETPRSSDSKTEAAWAGISR